MNVANRLNIRARFIDARMNPKFRIGPAVAEELIAIDVESEQIITAHQSGAHSRRKDESVGAGDAPAHVAERGGDALLV